MIPSRAPNQQRLRIGQIGIDSISFAETLDAIAAMIASREGGAILTPNVDHVVMAESDARFRRAYEEATLCVADGKPLIWASHLLGAPLPEKISGSDLVWPVLERAAANGWRVYLLGAGPGVGQLAAERATRRLPRLQIVGIDAPMIDMRAPAAARADVLDRLRATKPDVVLVGLGAPKQELFIAEARSELRGTVLIGVGASIDFIAGSMRRAPRWMSSAGLEWLFRLGQEPRRLWRRYLVQDPAFLLILLRDLRGPRP